MHPPQFRSGLSAFARWDLNEHTGKFDNALFCVEESRFSPQVCEQENQQILEDLLEVDLLNQELKRPSRVFYNFDHHHEGFERLEAFLRNAIKVFSEPNEHL